MNKTLSKILRRIGKNGLWTGSVLLLLLIVSLVISSQIPKHNPFYDGDFRYWPPRKDKATGEKTVSLFYVEGKTRGMEEFDIPTTANFYGKAYRITYIQAGAFSSCSNLARFTIPAGITNVDGAFSHCTNLTNIGVAQENKYYTSVDGVLFTIDMSSITAYPAGKKEDTYTIPNTVTDIGGGAFHSCYTLTNITIPESVTSIGWGAFSGCSSLTNIAIPNTVTNIGGSAFSGCNSLTNIAIPKGVTTLNYGTFHSCFNLTNIAIPESVTTIGGGAFASCTSLKNITIPKGVTHIGDRVFEDCTSLTSITIPEGVTTIDWGLFYGCSSLTDITIPKSVTCIDNWAFYGCSGLTNITIPEGVTRIGEGAFQNCINLRNVYFKGPRPTLDGIVFGMNIVLHPAEGATQ